MSTSKHVQYDEIKYNVVFKDMPFAQMYKKVLTAEGGRGGRGEIRLAACRQTLRISPISN